MYSQYNDVLRRQTRGHYLGIFLEDGGYDGEA